MKFPLYIARRYFFSRKSTNVINLISFIALIGIAFGSAALIIVLSIFNGFEDMARSMLNAFNPDLKVVSTRGKYFDKRVVDRVLDSVEGIEARSFVMVDNALIEYEDKQYIGYVKGVDENFVRVTGLDTMIMYGDFMLYYKSRPMAVVGSGIAYNLGVQLNFIGSLKLWLPRPKARISFDVSQMFVRTHIFPSGIFSVQKEFDEKYIFVPLDFLQSTLDMDEYTVTACEIKLAPGVDVAAIERRIQEKLGDGFDVKNRFEQQQMFYKIVRSERLAIIMILTFIIIIASFNVIATISMLIIDKRKDIEILNFLGSDSKTLKQIFLNQGFIINSIGIVVGLLFGVALVLAQKYLGLLRFPSTTSLMYLPYPVELRWVDIALTVGIVSLIGYFSSLIPVKYFIEKYFGNGKA